MTVMLFTSFRGDEKNEEKTIDSFLYPVHDDDDDN